MAWQLTWRFTNLHGRYWLQFYRLGAFNAFYGENKIRHYKNRLCLGISLFLCEKNVVYIIFYILLSLFCFIFHHFLILFPDVFY